MSDRVVSEESKRSRVTGALEGPRIVALATGVVVAACVLSLVLGGAGEEGARLAIRTTARTSLAIFSLAFAASALYAFWPNDFTRWLRRNRRYVGLSFAASHTVHLFFVLRVAFMADGFSAGEPGLTTVVGGGFGYVMMYAMAATSNGRAVRWLGRRRWQQLHTFGGHTVWLIFLVSTPLTPFVDLYPTIYLAIVGGAMALRVAHAWQRRAVRSPSP